MMLNLSCLCGQVRVVTGKKPDYINECNCAFCRKSGARWGYFHPTDVRVEGAVKGYRRADKADPGAQLGFCGNCGATTHWTLTENAAARFGDALMGVNMRLADESDLAGVELRFPDGQAWSGEGDFSYVREARIIGERETSD